MHNIKHWYKTLILNRNLDDLSSIEVKFSQQVICAFMFQLASPASWISMIHDQDWAGNTQLHSHGWLSHHQVNSWCRWGDHFVDYIYIFFWNWKRPQNLRSSFLEWQSSSSKHTTKNNRQSAQKKGEKRE